MRRYARLALLIFLTAIVGFSPAIVSAQTTITTTRADGTQLGSGVNSRAGLNLVEILADSPYNKNILNGNSGDVGFEYQIVNQIWQTQTGQTLTTALWQTGINNANFGPYVGDQWAHASFSVVQGPDTGYSGAVVHNTPSGQSGYVTSTGTSTVAVVSGGNSFTGWVPTLPLTIGGTSYTFSSASGANLTVNTTVPASPTGVVSTSGTTATYVSGTNFAGLAAGNVIVINSVAYSIQTATSSTSLVLSTSAGTQTSVAYSQTYQYVLSGTGAWFQVTPANTVAFQAGDVIQIGTNCNMTNVCPTPAAQFITNSYMGAWSVSNSATLAGDITPGDLCATCGKQSVAVTLPASNSSATLQLQFAGGTVQKSLVMNGTFNVSWWAKCTSGTNCPKVSGLVLARSGSNCTIAAQASTTSWAQYTQSCVFNETTTGSGNAIAQFSIAANGGAGSVLFDNVSMTNNADTNGSQFTNALVNSLEAWGQTAQNTTGVKPTLRYSPDPTITTLANIINNEMQQSPSPEGGQTNLSSTYTKTKVGFNEFLQLCQVAGFTPELIMPITMSTADAAFFADFLQGTNTSLAGVQARQALGQSGPWVGSVASGAPFQIIYLEWGNENWNGAFLGEALGFRSGEAGSVLGDYSRWMGTIDTAFRTEQTTQGYAQSQTAWVANAQTAGNGSTMADTATTGWPDLFEFDGYSSFGLDSVTSSSCTSFSGTTCDLYMTGVSEAYLNVHDPSSPHGFYQSLNEASSLTTCGPGHNARCRASVYEENVYPVGNAAGPVTQAVTDSYTQTGNQGVMAATQVLENATAVFNGEGLEVQNYYHSHQFFQGEGGVNVHMWGIMLDSGGDCSVTNASVFGGSYCPRPQMQGVQVANWGMLGHAVSCPNNSPTYTIPNMGSPNNNSLTIGQTVPYVTTYCFASSFPVGSGTTLSEVFVNRHPATTYTIALSGTNVPTTVTEYQFASPSLTSANELGSLSSLSTNVINGTTSGIINSGPTSSVSASALTAPPMSVTAVKWTTSGNPPAATPTFSPGAGTYTSAQSVTISDATSGATIFYTTDGSTPTTASTQYASPITVSGTETVQAIATASGATQSAIGSATYTITLPAGATPTFSPGTGTYSGPQTVTISSTSPGAITCWNTTGSPSTNGTTGCGATSTLYSGPITVGSTETVYAVAGGTGFGDGTAGTAVYTMQVAADFGSRTGGTAIPAQWQGVNDMHHLDTTSTTTAVGAGLKMSRVVASLNQIYASCPTTCTPNYASAIQGQSDLAASSGYSLEVYITFTPPDLATGACSGGPGVPPSNNTTWATRAAALIAWLDARHPGLVKYWAVWNEPDLTSLFCPGSGTNLQAYLPLYAAAAPAMIAQVAADGSTALVGGPELGSPGANAATWFANTSTGLLGNSGTSPYVQFASFHSYLSGCTTTWAACLSTLQNTSTGEAALYKSIDTLVRAGSQPNASTTPILVTETNDSAAFSADPIRNDPTYGPLWNAVSGVDWLNTINSGATSIPQGVWYFDAASSVGADFYCLFGNTTTGDCNPNSLQPYPQFYFYQLADAPNFLNLTAGGHLASSVSPSNSASGLNATAFYNGNATDSVLIVNPTATAMNGVVVNLTHHGLTSPTATQYLLNSTNSTITSSSLSLSTITNGLSATVNVPALSTMAVQLTGQAPAPTFSLAAGTYSGTLSITLSDSASGATIYYTTDGSTPTTSSTVYSSAISVSVTKTIKAIATATGATTSAVASATYTIVVPTPPQVRFGGRAQHGGLSIIH